MYSPPGATYHQAFTALTRELDRDLYKNDLVVATTDDRVFVDWVGFRRRYSFLVKSWNTTLSNHEIEGRILWFAREERLDPASLAKFANQRTILYYWLDSDFYQVLPPDKINELQDRYARILTKDEKEMPRLDLIVLAADTKLFPLPDPDPAKYTLTYHDDYFRVFQAIKPASHER